MLSPIDVVRAGLFLVLLAFPAMVRAQAAPPVDGIQKLHVTPNGAGNRSGSDMNNAMDVDFAIRHVAKRGVAVHIILAPGRYNLTERAPVELIGDNRFPLIIEGAGPTTILEGSYEPSDDRGSPLFLLRRDKVTLRNFAVRNVGQFLIVGRESKARDIRISGISIQDVHDGIVIDRATNVVASNWLIENVRISGYVRVGVRLSGAETSRIVLRASTIDGQGRVNNCFKGGIQLYERVHDVTIEDVTIANNVGCEEIEYQQGDGIEADNKQGAPSRITLRRVRVSGSRDGNFDLKAQDMVLEDLVSEGKGNTRFGFRLWNFRYTCLRCRHTGAGAPLQSLNATIMLNGFEPAGTDLRVRCNDRSGHERSRITVSAEGGTGRELECSR